MILSEYVPEILLKREALNAEYNEACRLLDDLEKDDNSAEVELNFIRLRITQLKKEQHATDDATLQILEQFRNNNRLYVILMLRYFVGYKWEDIGKLLHIKVNAAKARVLRAFKKAFLAPSSF